MPISAPIVPPNIIKNHSVFSGVRRAPVRRDRALSSPKAKKVTILTVTKYQVHQGKLYSVSIVFMAFTIFGR